MQIAGMVIPKGIQSQQQQGHALRVPGSSSAVYAII